MVIAVCTVQLELYGIASLKDKRSVVKSIVRRLPRQFAVTTAEIEYHDVWNMALIGIVTIGVDAGHLHGRLEKTVEWIEKHRPDTVIVDYSIEYR